jgi:RNA polymerase sigma factor (sigma-70 family)
VTCVSHPDLELVKCALLGAADAMRAVVDRCEVPIQVTVLRRCPGLSGEELDDLLQDIRYRLLTSLKNFRGDASLKTFACGIAKNRVRHFFALRDRHRVPAQDPLDPSAPPILCDRPLPDISVIQEDLLHLIRQRLPGQLSRREADCYGLFYSEGLSIEEIEQRMDASRGNVDKMLSCIRSKARRLILELDEEPVDRPSSDS